MSVYNDKWLTEDWYFIPPPMCVTTVCLMLDTSTRGGPLPPPALSSFYEWLSQLS